MIIDTEKLRLAMDDYYAKRTIKTDKIKNNEIAIRELTRLETEQIIEEKLIAEIEALNAQYFS